jgi:hypothetical protein
VRQGRGHQVVRGTTRRRKVGEGSGLTDRWWTADTSPTAARLGGRHARAHGRR